MPVNTRIQFRRGTATEWTNSVSALGQGILYQGELGFERDTGKFKIGNGTAHWNNLPYAGGTQIIPETGIGLTFDSSSNAYTLYSVITGAVGQAGITFETLPLSGLLNNVNASGTYYRIALSTKLENFHDSNINISSNLISSSTSGITISGFNFSTIDLNPSGGPVRASGIDIRNLTDTITVTSGIGGLSVGETFTTASGITSLLKRMLEKVFEPTVGVQPSVSISLNGLVSPIGSSSSFTNGGRYEVGTTGNITITSTLNQGQVWGTGLGAGWATNGVQGVRAGTATAYTRTLTGGNADSTFATNNTFNNYTVTLGSNIASGIITHNSGITPVNSLGVNSTVLTVLASGGTVSNSNTFTGVRRLFYVYDTSTSVPNTSAAVRALASTGATFDGVKSIWDFGVNTVFRVTPPIGTKRVIIAVPSGMYSLGNTIDAFDESANTNVTTSYPRTTVSVSGANGAAPITYNIYSLVPDVPFVNSPTHRITLQ